MERIDKLFMEISINIIVMFSIWFLWSFVGDYMRDTNIFNDVYTEGSHNGWNMSETSWGIRHYLWNWCWFITALLMIVRLGFKIGGKIERTEWD